MSDYEGFVRIPSDKPQWLPILRDLYRFEQTKVAGPGSYSRRFSDVAWTKKSAIEHLNLSKEDSKEFDDMISFLDKNRQIMVVKATENKPAKHITRVAELVRILGHTYEYWHKGRPSVSATRWLIQDKQIPARVIPAEIFVESIKKKCEELVPGPKGLNLLTAAEEVCIAVAKSINKNWKSISFAEFQLTATIKILESRYGSDNPYKAQILTAGVGSGKTIAFSIATLIEARKTMIDGHSNQSQKSTGLFIYPRSQLAMDQYSELVDFANHLDCDLPLWLEMSESYKKEGTSVARGVVSKYSEDATPLGVIVTTFETLKRRMRRPEFMKKIGKHLSTIVVDEVHLLSGISGGQSAQLLSRLSQAVADSEKEVHWIGASATIARPDIHGSRLFNLEPSEVQVIAPTDGEMVQAGINHHIFIRPNQGMSLRGTLVNATSLTVSNRRVDLSKRKGKQDKKRQKSIAFADNLELLGRWNDDLKENERTQQVSRGRQHPSKDTKIEDWRPLQREIPYTWRFNKPMQRRLATYGGDDEKNPGDAYKDLRNLFEKEKVNKICDVCRSGNSLVLGEISHEDLLELSKIVYRTNHKQDDEIKAHLIDSEEFRATENRIIGTHENCPFLQSGACNWFPEPNTSEVFEIPGTKNPVKIDFAAVTRSSVFSAKTPDTEGDEESIIERIYQDNVKSIFDVGSSNQRRPVDIVLASPSLEVGVDMPMITESILVKAVRNIAAYRQKVGRVGREENLDTVNVTLISQSNVDLHYYRQPRKLVSEGRLEPVPLMEHNQAIVASSAYAAIWEWLAINANLPEYIERRRDGSIGKRMKNCLKQLTDKADSIISYTQSAVGDKGKYKSLVLEAIEQIKKEISLLTLPTESSYSVTPSLDFEPTVIDLFSLHLENVSESRISYEIKKRHEEAGKSLDEVENYCNEIIENLEQILSESGKFQDSDIELIKNLKDSLNKRSFEDNTKQELSDVRNLLKNIDEFNFETYTQDAIEDAETNIKRLLRELQKISSSGINNDVVSLYNNYTNFDTKVHGGVWKRSYLSDTMDNLELIEIHRRNSWFLRPDTLFQNPYEEKVKLTIKRLDGKEPEQLDSKQSEIAVSEALFAYLPGMFTHRIPHRRFKIMTGNLLPSGGKVIAKLDRMEAVGNRFKNINSAPLPPPPGTRDSLQIYSPTELVLLESFQKYTDLNKNTLQIMDKDESDKESLALAVTKIPKSFQNRWAWSEENHGNLIPAFNLHGHKYKFENQGNTTDIESYEKILKHPICNNLIDSVEWLDEKEVIEYTYSLNRSFGGKGEIDLGYQDYHDRSIAFGQKFKTEGIAFELNKNIISNLKDKFRQDITNGLGKVSPSIIKCFKAYVLTDTEFGGATINGYSLEDMISANLIFNEWQNTPITPSKLVEFFSYSINNKTEFTKCLDKFVRAKMSLAQKYDEETDTFEPDEIVSSRVNQMIDSLAIYQNLLPNFDAFVENWIHRTTLSTFGIVATNSMQQFCGCDEKDVAYLIEDESWNGGNTRVIVYDRAQFGNGSCATARDYMHIPHVIRTSKYSKGIRLPSTDFLSTLEENLLQCIQHQSDMCSVELISKPDSSTISSMPDLVKHAEESKEIGIETWNKLGINSINQAWTLPIHVRLAAHYEDKLEHPMDDTIRSCTICWNGCPECVDQLPNALGGMLGMNFIDKYLVDDWFNIGVADSVDYQYLQFDEMSTGDANMHFGSLNKLHLITPDKESKRSICLPWTMGFHIERSSPFKTRLIIRSTDVSNLRIGDRTGGAFGIAGHGFERLLWFNLLMSSHLDAVGVLPKEKKHLRLLYYDARDLPIKDLGLSPRMMDSMLAVNNGEPLEKLSDVLRWMLKRGFKIELCVDKNQATNKPVRQFLQRLRDFDNANLLQRVSESGSMHKKILISPIGAMTGSANLTYSGSNLNDEDIQHVTVNNKSQYKSVIAGAGDTLMDAEPFDFDYVKSFNHESSSTDNPNNKHSQMSDFDRVISQLENGTLEGSESLELEFKVSYNKSDPNDNTKGRKDSVDIVFREVAGMLNTSGGHVFIGIEDKTHRVVGIDDQIGDKSNDYFETTVHNEFVNRFGPGYGEYVSSKLKLIQGKKILIISCKKYNSRPVFMDPMGNLYKKDKFSENKGCLFVRQDDNTNAMLAYNIEKVGNWSQERFGDRNICFN